MQDELGPTAAQVCHFARKLREISNDDVDLEDGGIIYRIFVDRRWDSVPGIVHAGRVHKVSYTATVMRTHRYHVIGGPKHPGLSQYVKKSKVSVTFLFDYISYTHSQSHIWPQVRKNRGKYRAATTTVGVGDEAVTLTELLWNDSSLVGCISADLGSEQEVVDRRMGRWTVPIPCPKMMVVRDKNFRAVDQIDQLRLCKWSFDFICRNKA